MNGIQFMGYSCLRSMVGRTIIIGDVHGCYRELVDLLAGISFDQKDDKVVFVGDLVGKGPYSEKVVQYAMDINAVSVRGNHEDVLIRHYQYTVLNDTSVEKHTLRGTHKSAAKNLTDGQWKYLLDMPMYLRIEEYNTLVVHAGIAPNIPLEEQNPFLMMNMRNILPDGTCTKEQGDTPWIESWNGPETLFFGHDAVRGLQIRRDPETDRLLAMGLDTGACYGKKLTGYVFPEGKVITQDSYEVYEAPSLPLQDGDTPQTDK